MVAPAAAQDRERTSYLCVNIAGHTAPVRGLGFTSDSQYLVSAGLDKLVHVWRLPRRGEGQLRPRAIPIEAWTKESTVRWEMARGLRGAIYALAVSPVHDFVAIGGYGARGSAGDITRLALPEGPFLPLLRVHRDAVTCLAFSSDGRWLASLDRSGQALLWDPQDRSIPLTQTDFSVYGAAEAAHIAGSVRIRRLAVLANRAVLLPHYEGRDAEGMATWRIRQYALPDGRLEGSLPALHEGAVNALAASRDGLLAASSDRRRLFLWDLRNPSEPIEIPTPRMIISLAFSPRNDLLLAGSWPTPDDRETELQLRELPSGRLRWRRSLSDSVHACAFSPDGQRFAYTGGDNNEIFVEWLDRAGAEVKPGERLTLEGGPQIERAAFAGAGQGHAVRFTNTARRGGPAQTKVFDPATLDLRASAAAVPSAVVQLGGWSGSIDRRENVVRLLRDGQPSGQVPVDAQRQGLAESFCFIPGADGQAEAVAVGTNLQCGAFVYELPAGGACRLLRYFRGHQDVVTSLSVSADRRYLLSGSRDGNIRIWSLSGYREGTSMAGRWGAQFELRGGRLAVGLLDDLGPLYNRGVRSGDTLERIQWMGPGGVQEARDPNQIAGQLQSLPWDAQVNFHFARNGRPRESFQLLGAWHSLLGLYVTAGDDWIAWTTPGYYACSAGGERLIGWQVNNELGQKPSFYTADQYHKVFYRPDVIRTLLAAGSMERALAGGGLSRLSIGEVTPPQVEILQPRQLDARCDQAEIEVVARAQTAGGRPMQAMWLQLDGRPFDPASAARTIAGGRSQQTHRWRVPLTPGTHRLVVWAEDELSQGRSEAVRVQCTRPGEAIPSLYVLAVGISTYRYAPLEFGHSDAARFVRAVDVRGSSLFEKIEVRTLTNQQATRRGFEQGLAWLTGRLQAKRTGEDVGVIYFSGHGIIDPRERFFLCPVDASVDSPDDTCVSAAEIKRFCQEVTPCRLVLFLDACHAGAAGFSTSEALAQAQQKQALELARRDCGVLVIASCQANQKAVEDRQWDGGAFTKALVDALAGAGCCRDQDTVDVPQLYVFLRDEVRRLTEGLQTPTINFDNPFAAGISFPLVRLPASKPAGY